MDKPFTRFEIQERSYVAYAKREIHNDLTKTHFNEVRIAEIDIIVSEICSNLIKHAGGGELLYRVFDMDKKDSVFEIVCVDQGPGMSDTSRMMKDGISTTRTLGQGLGAIDRLSDNFQIYSIPAWGTVLFSRVTTRKDKFVRKTGYNIEIRGLNVPKPRETLSGDGYSVKRSGSEIQVFFGDGLGHGEHAYEAVKKASDFFFECKESDPVDIIRQMHERVRRTRGLVTSVAVLDLNLAKWRICGVGNIVTRLYNGIVYKNYMAYNGTVGLNIPSSMKESLFDCEKNQHLVMCSDGIRTRWDINKYPSIFKYDNILLAAALYKDFTRGNDDATTLIAKVS